MSDPTFTFPHLLEQITITHRMSLHLPITHSIVISARSEGHCLLSNRLAIILLIVFPFMYQVLVAKIISGL